MLWERMSIDELATFSRANGMMVQKVDDIWWAEVRPLFFRPLFPFAQLDPKCHYPAKSMLGGVLHAVSPRGPVNAHMDLFVYDDLQNYSLNGLEERQRQATRKGIKNFTARKITDAEELITEGYKTYLSFYDRTNYGYKKERIIKENFTSWAKSKIENPKVVVTGAYHEKKLAAIDISYRVDDVIFDDVFFSDSESQPLKVTDFMLHSIREAAASTDAKYLFRGLPSGKQSLDESKTRRRCKILKIPAYCRINPAALFLSKYLMKDSYKKLAALLLAALLL